MTIDNPSWLAMASGDLYVKLLRTALADRRIPDRGDPVKSRLLRLQKEYSLLSERESEEIAHLLDALANETDGTAQRTKVDGIHQELVDRNASPVAIAISSIARSSMNSEKELLDTAMPKGNKEGSPGKWNLSPESQGDPVSDQVGAAIVGACLGAAVPGGNVSMAVLGSIIGAAVLGAYFQP
jgi:hypothetical protein